jgi:hypothetical protein
VAILILRQIPKILANLVGFGQAAAVGSLFLVIQSKLGSGSEKTTYVVMRARLQKPDSNCMAHSTIPDLYGSFCKAEARNEDYPLIKSESSSAHMLVFAMVYTAGMLLTLTAVAVLYHWR